MKQYTTEAAKSLITIIGTEYALGQTRVARGFIKEDRMLGTVLERLNRLSVHNVDLRAFLDNIGFIPDEEDEGEDYPWAKDERDGGDNRVESGLGSHPRFGLPNNVLTKGIAGG